jgi:hypothetical protein
MGFYFACVALVQRAVKNNWIGAMERCDSALYHLRLPWHETGPVTTEQLALLCRFISHNLNPGTGSGACGSLLRVQKLNKRLREMNFETRIDDYEMEGDITDR